SMDYQGLGRVRMTRHVSIQELVAKFETRAGLLGVIGLGYVGLPICLAAANAGLRVLGFDVNPAKPEFLARGESCLKHIESAEIGAAVGTGRFHSTTDFDR